ncbi:hypothetical protein ACE6H2_025104 [Prunus campanulata]
MKKLEEGLVNQAVARTLEIHVTQSRLTQQPSDILVFLPGQQEIEAVDQMLRQVRKDRGHGKLIVCPIIHAQALEPTPQGAREVVLATSACSSLNNKFGPHVNTEDCPTQSQKLYQHVHVSRIAGLL